MKKVRLSMELVREVLRLKWKEKQSNRLIGKMLHISKSTVGNYVAKVEMGKIFTLDELNAISDEDLKKIVFPNKFSKEEKESLDFSTIHKELKRKHVTLKLLWEEEAEKNPNISKYSNYCRLYSSWKKKQRISMRQVHKAGEKGFIDYAGRTVPVKCGKNGEIEEAEIFLMSLGASHYTYVEGSWTQNSEDFLRSHINAFEYFGGVPSVWVPDNLRSAVSMASKYEPEINRSYRELSKHYGAVVIPARVRKPKDKAIVENEVLHVSRWILAKIRDEEFFSLEELNERLRELLIQYNNKKLQGLNDSRKSLFESLERTALLPLPSRRFEIAHWKKAKSNIDYHVVLEGSYYSIPYKYRGMELLIRYTDFTVEVFHMRKRIAVHKRAIKERSCSTIKEHMPSYHKEYGDWSPSRILNWASSVGSSCGVRCVKRFWSQGNILNRVTVLVLVLSVWKRSTPKKDWKMLAVEDWI